MGLKLFRPNIMYINIGPVTLSEVLLNYDLYPCTLQHRSPPETVEFGVLEIIKKGTTGLEHLK